MQTAFNTGILDINLFFIKNILLTFRKRKIIIRVNQILVLTRRVEKLVELNSDHRW
jgi:hypothetical protein